MNAEFEVFDSAKRVSRSAVEKAEREHAFRIPDEYKAFLLKHNGGHPRRCCFRFGKGAYRDSLVGSFFSVGGPGYMNLAHYVEVYSDRLPANYFPIANDPGGNLIVISCSGPTKGAVYFWDHEHEGKKALHRVAKSFDDFLALLTEEEPLEEPDGYPVRVMYDDGSVEGMYSTAQLFSGDRQQLVGLFDLRPGETIDMFGLRRRLASIEREPFIQKSAKNKRSKRRKK